MVYYVSGPQSFIGPNNIPLHGYTSFIDSSVSGYVGCFHFGAMNNAAINIRDFCGDMCIFQFP